MNEPLDIPKGIVVAEMMERLLAAFNALQVRVQQLEVATKALYQPPISQAKDW